jgi:hypothetical protein
VSTVLSLAPAKQRSPAVTLFRKRSSFRTTSRTTLKAIASEPVIAVASFALTTVGTVVAGLSIDTSAIIDVVWCVDHNGDHGGMFTYRICQDQALVDKFLDPDYK